MVGKDFFRKKCFPFFFHKTQRSRNITISDFYRKDRKRPWPDFQNQWLDFITQGGVIKILQYTHNLSCLPLQHHFLPQGCPGIFPAEGFNRLFVNEKGLKVVGSKRYIE